jgi:hypothetical protein
MQKPELEPRSARDAAADDCVEFWPAGTLTKGCFRCVACGHAVTVRQCLPRCQGCGERLWERAEWSPLARRIDAYGQ